jgi:TonB family protein
MNKGRIQLEVIRADQVLETKTFSGDSIEIGKLTRSDLKLEDENVSRRHARIEIDSEGRVQLVDLKSTNGTKLNGMRVNKAHLTDGDEIVIGLLTIRVRLDAELQKAASDAAPSPRTQINREGFYRTQEAAPGKGKLALEGALLWEDSPIQVDAFRRSFLPVRLKAALLFLFAIGPLEFWILSGIAGAVSTDANFSIAAGAAGLGLAIYFMMDIDGWRSLLSNSLNDLRRGEAIFVGETAGSRFFVPSETVGGVEYPLLVPHKRGWALNLLNDEIKGDLLHDGKVMTLLEARKNASLVKNKQLPMTPGTKCRLRLGQFSMLLSYVAVPPKPKGGFISAMNIQEMAYMVLSLMIHFGLLILFVYLQPEGDIQIRRSNSEMLARVFNVESIKANEKEEDKEEEEELPEKVEFEEDEPEIELDTPSITQSEKFLPEEQETEKVDFNKTDKTEKFEKPTTPEERDKRRTEKVKVAKKTAEAYIPTEMLAQVTGTNFLNTARPSLGVKVIGGGPAVAGGEAGPTSAMAANAGSQGGFAGLSGDMGGTAGLGGPGGGPGGKGGLVAGLDKKDGKGKKYGGVKFKEKKLRAIVATGAVSTSGGGLTKKIIRKYINRQKGSIIHCYKKEVQKSPGLEGKVVVSFTISPTGSVMRPSIKSSTLGSSRAEGCITKRLARWRFPAPLNAGAVRVSYPFLFRTR